MKVGLQLFTLINIMKTEDGLRKAIKHAAEAGYDGVEFAGFHGLSVEEIKAELDKYGLEAAGLHLGWGNMTLDNLENDPEGVIDTAKKLGLHSVTVASYGGQTREEWLAFAARINNYGKLFRENGIRLGYHNHRHEFKQIDGEFIIDLFLSNCEAENVFWEIDPRHIVVAGQDPVAFSKKYNGRAPFFHVRDLEKITGPDTAQDCAAGSGIVDLKGAITASGAHEWLIVEEGPLDDDAEMLKHIKQSADYIRANF